MKQFNRRFRPRDAAWAKRQSIGRKSKCPCTRILSKVTRRRVSERARLLDFESLNEWKPPAHLASEKERGRDWIGFLKNKTAGGGSFALPECQCSVPESQSAIRPLRRYGGANTTTTSCCCGRSGGGGGGSCRRQSLPLPTATGPCRQAGR